jgi:hypothetical protein
VSIGYDYGDHGHRASLDRSRYRVRETNRRLTAQTLCSRSTSSPPARSTGFPCRGEVFVSACAARPTCSCERYPGGAIIPFPWTHSSARLEHFQVLVRPPNFPTESRAPSVIGHSMNDLLCQLGVSSRATSTRSDMSRKFLIDAGSYGFFSAPNL